MLGLLTRFYCDLRVSFPAISLLAIEDAFSQIQQKNRFKSHLGITDFGN